MAYACNLCGSRQHTSLFPGRDRMHGIEGRFEIIRCDACGLYRRMPALTPKQAAKYYSAGYYSFQHADPASARSRLERKVYASFYSGRWSPMRILLLPVKPLFRGTRVIPGGRILDVGCGSGSFLLQMKLLGMEPYGVEPGDFDEKYARKHGLRIKRGTLEQARFKDGHFDVITVNHVFEHVEDPAATLRELKRILKPGGTLIIGVPQTRSLAAKLFGEHWVQLDVPRHSFLFSTENLKSYAARTGLAVERVVYNSLPFQFTGSTLYATNRFRKKEILLQDWTQSKAVFLLLLPLSYLCNILRIGDQVEIVLRRRAGSRRPSTR